VNVDKKVRKITGTLWKIRYNTQNGNKDIMDGIKLGAALGYIYDIDICSTHYLCEKIKKDTSDLSLDNRSYLSLLKSDTEHPYYVRKAQYFITYAWELPIGLTLQAVLREIINQNKCSLWEAKNFYIWMDVFCVDQHQAGLGNLDFKHWEQVFGETLKGIGKAIVVLSPLEQPIYPTRAWCVFELFTIFQNNIPYAVVTDSKDEEKFTDRVVQGLRSLYKFSGIFSLVNVEAAQATSNDDLMKILPRLREIGVVNVNNMLMKVLKEKFEYIHFWCLGLYGPDTCSVLDSQGTLYRAMVRLYNGCSI
jgi:hypothetical protein